jgi:hypothetical protein
MANMANAVGIVQLAKYLAQQYLHEPELVVRDLA